ncbi:MAG: acyltransferase [Dokdonella sp.]
MRNTFAQLRGTRLDVALATGRDNFLLLRFTAAILVLLGHSYVLTSVGGSQYDPLMRLTGHLYLGFVGVAIFFTVSGFLIALSWQRHPQIGRFARARALRIFPALIACVAISTLLLGPAITRLPLSDYFDDGGTWRYLIGNASLLDLRMNLPGVFAANPATDAVNGSLWTLPVEVLLYILVAALGIVGLLRKPLLATLALALLVAVPLFLPLQQGNPGYIPQFQLAAFFVFGVLAALHRQRVWLSTPVVIILLIACAVCHGHRSVPLLIAVLIAYGTLWLAYVPRLPQIPRTLDISYGTYLWGFPVQQWLMALFSISAPATLFLLSLPFTLLLAGLSWFAIERPALRLKRHARAEKEHAHDYS